MIVPREFQSKISSERMLSSQRNRKTDSVFESRAARKARKYGENDKETRSPVARVKKIAKSSKKLVHERIAKLNELRTAKLTGKNVKLTLDDAKTTRRRNLIALRRYDSKFEEISKKYGILADNVETTIAIALKLVEENPKLKNSLFLEKFPVFLQLNLVKVPKNSAPKWTRIELEHSLFDAADDDICLIVPDVKGLAKKEYDKHVERYEELLKASNVAGIKKIMTLHQIKFEYDTFELKRNLAELYDLFIVDGRISGQIVRQLGKTFYKKRKIPTPLKLTNDGGGALKRNFELSMKKTAFQVHSKGDSFMLHIGHSKMTFRELTENCLKAIDQLDAKFPGGIANMRTINVFTPRGASLPIRVSLDNPNLIATPEMKRQKRPKHFETVEGELTTKLGHFVRVEPTGDISLRRDGSTED